MLYSRVYFSSLSLLIAVFCFMGCSQQAEKTKQKVLQHTEAAWQYKNVNNDSSLYHAENALQLARKQNDTALMVKPMLIKAEVLALFGNIDQSVACFKNGIALAESVPDYKHWSLGLSLLGEQYYNQGQYDKSLLLFLESLNLGRSHNLPHSQALALHYIGKYYHTTGEMDNSIKYYQKSLIIATETSDTVLQVSLHNKMGKHHETLGNYSDALASYIKAEKILHGVNNNVLEATTYNHLGNIYHELNNMDKAMLYHNKALKLRDNLGYTEGVGKSLKNIGEIFESKNFHDTAIVCYQQALLLCKQVHYKKGQIKSLNNLGRALWKNGDTLNGYRHVKSALRMAQDAGYTKGEIKAAIDLATIYLSMDSTRASIELLKYVTQLAGNDEYRGDLRQAYFQLYKAYKANNNHNALQYLEQYNALNQYFINTQRNKQIAEMQVAYAFEKQSRVNERLKQENTLALLNLNKQKQQKWFLFLLSILILAVFTLYLSRQKQKNKANAVLMEMTRKIQSNNSQFKKLNAELNEINHEKDRLFSIISHELRNPLYWTKNLIELLNNKLDNITKTELKDITASLDESAKATYHLMDNLLNWSKAQLNRINSQPCDFSLSDIIDDNLNYFASQAKQKNITISVSPDPTSIVHADPEMVKLVLRNLLSNALKFTPNNGAIQISVQAHSQHVSIAVADTGKGIQQEHIQQLFDKKYSYTTLGLMKEKGNGLGLLLCKEFTERNQGKIYLENTSEQGSVFVFTLPLSTTYQLV